MDITSVCWYILHRYYYDVYVDVEFRYTYFVIVIEPLTQFSDEKLGISSIPIYKGTANIVRNSTFAYCV